MGASGEEVHGVVLGHGVSLDADLCIILIGFWRFNFALCFI